MIYIRNDDNRPQFNLALEQYVFDNLDQFDEIFLLWINEPSIIVGKHQNTIQEINLDYVRENNINVVRRLSGGGAVYHDYGNLNYTIISKSKDTSAFNFEAFTKPVIEVLAKLGIKAEFTGRNDITIDGKKFCGNAQYMKKGKVLHHGAMLFDTDLEVLEKALKVSKDKIESKGVKSVRSRVTNIKDHLKEDITIEDFKQLLLEHMFKGNKEIKEYKLTEEDYANINKLMEERYATWEWNFGSSPDFNIEKSRRFSSGKVETKIDVQEGIIKGIKFYGDFFGSGEISDVENKLVGIRYKEDEISSILDTIDIGYYFSGMTKDDIMTCII
ncbi:lipoate--protein ligase [Tepidimicrobium xylanilyticum]|uniref:lipoate--protein ligase n=1 Tax=Tepidimicrobium xylanilyticum TaxID=1123352 RepID=A0A1H3D7S8_9FIRM|nr:lipoate--protein ligase [Tepidimicrobium xylanilyticum]GMG97913.1 dihydrolipoamide acetyltransferase [Tepidimicrobium xylanilyticum]SDX61739.1 lipoate-protein ligase A [Tepidimicrobium xylanilyticum]